MISTLHRFDLGAGFLAGANLGYGLHNFRIEAEYFHREQMGLQYFF